MSTTLARLAALASLALVGFASSAGAQNAFSNLGACADAAFSVEEDFITRGPEPPDGDPYISDGDVLSPRGAVCVRQRELMRPFDITEDLGLDALDILAHERAVIAFSTELDSPHGQFTAGDLLLTDGSAQAVVPNAALVRRFQIANDVGLDEVKFVGEPERIRRFVELAFDTDPDAWRERDLAETLKEIGIDIWFSIEGTRWSRTPLLDGDVLSVVNGVVATNRDLLAPGAPAGLPSDGVDFGLDAFATARDAIEAARELGAFFFSTELLFADGIRFTDGDIVQVGGAMVAENGVLIAAFEPAAKFLGLDALWFDLAEGEPRITLMCDLSTSEFDGGVVPVGGPGRGLHQSPLTAPPALTDTLERPCGLDVPVDGAIPVPPDDITRFRVAYREHTAPPPAAPGAAATAAIQTRWDLLGPRVIWTPGVGRDTVCDVPRTLSTDAQGWMDAQTYVDAKNGIGTFAGCPHPELRLAVWRTTSLPAGTPDGMSVPGVDDREDHYVLWLEWEDADGDLHREGVEHHLQLDNTLPRIADYPNGLQLRVSADAEPILACDETPASAANLQVWGQIHDRYYSRFWLRLLGGEPPAHQNYGPHRFHEPHDGTPGVKNTDDTGTTPDAATVRLRDIAMTDLGASYTECCYALMIRVWDRSIRHRLQNHGGRSVVNEVSDRIYTWRPMTFASEP